MFPRRWMEISVPGESCNCSRNSEGMTNWPLALRRADRVLTQTFYPIVRCNPRGKAFCSKYNNVRYVRSEWLRQHSRRTRALPGGVLLAFFSCGRADGLG